MSKIGTRLERLERITTTEYIPPLSQEEMIDIYCSMRVLYTDQEAKSLLAPVEKNGRPMHPESAPPSTILRCVRMLLLADEGIDPEDVYRAKYGPEAQQVTIQD